MEAAPRVRTAALLLVLLAAVIAARSSASAAPPAPAGERWVGLRVADPELRRLAVQDVAGPLNGVADAIPFLVIALGDESAPVRAAARERLHALAAEAVDPLLDALEGARPGAKSTFGVLSMLGKVVTLADLASAAGANTPTNPPDRREAALMLALDTSWLRGVREPEPPDARLRLGMLLLGDPDESVRRAAAASLGLLGLVAARPEPGKLPLVLTRPQRERLAELLQHGSPEIAKGAAGLAARFLDTGEPVVKALEDLVAKEATRDEAGIALAALGEASRPALPTLKRCTSYGTLRALVRLNDESVTEALAAKQTSARRMAAAALLDEEGGSAAVAKVFLEALEEVREDGSFAKIEKRLLPLWVVAGHAGEALPALAAMAGDEKADPDVRDLASAVALRIDRSAAWAEARVKARLANPPSPKPGADGAATRLATATVLAVAFERGVAPLADPPAALATVDLSTAALDGEPLGLALARTRALLTPTSGYVLLLTRALEVTPPQRASAWSAPTLRGFAQQGREVAASWWVRKAALEVLADPALATPERKALLLALLDAPDPWLRHLAARAARRSGQK